ncbi:clasp N terminal-domain-containing protein [Irpex rosettiformis]|uniref:Clasp N terminal-domain-containing protein n=1 Tax=Irpex rosettiformis TaxID=378272 RepID=A0ACB8TSY9_9APHY|nr:clasp N terminal-domain-containing protein [Irpex rosettiformis]
MTLEIELQGVKDTLSLKESEDTWGAIANALVTLKQAIQHNSTELPDKLVVTLRAHAQAINNAATSERSRLSGHALDLLSTSVIELGNTFDPLLSLFIPTLLTLSSRPNKSFEPSSEFGRKMTLEIELQGVKDTLSLKESEDTWGAIANALVTLKQAIQHNSTELPDKLVVTLRAHAQAINNAATSERSRLSGHALDLLSTSVIELGNTFDPLLSLFIPTLLTLSSRPNKVFVSRARDCLNTIVSCTQSSVVLPLLVHHIHDKSTSVRLTVAETALTYLNCANPPDVQREARAKDVELLIKAAAVDANADVRKYGRDLFDAYKVLLPERVHSFTAPLTPTIRKYLNIRGASGSSTQPISRPASSLHLNSSTNTCRRQVEPAKPGAASRSTRSTTRTVPSHDASHPEFSVPSSLDAVPSTLRTRDAATPTLIMPYSRPHSRADSCTSIASSGRVKGAMSACSSDVNDAEPRPNSIMAQSNCDNSSPQKPKVGPLRPGLSHPDAISTTNDKMQRRAGGARRVLRPEQPQNEVEQQSHPKGPIRPSHAATTTAPSTSHITATQRKGPGVPARPAKSNTSSSQKRAAEPPSQPDTSQKKDASRLTKPTTSQLARQRQAASGSQCRTEAAAKAKEHHSSRTLKVSKQGKIELPKTKQFSDLLPQRVVNANNFLPKVVEPINIPLPPSPAEVLPSLEAADTPFAAVKNEQTPMRPPLPPPVYPATPVTNSKLSSLPSVEQTPITALVDAIRDGFIFTPRAVVSNDSVDDYEEEADDTFRIDADDPKLLVIPPLDWKRKPTSMSG